VPELNVAVIGAGRMGVFHAETWEGIESARLVAVADPDEAVARRAIGRRPIRWDADWRETLADDEIAAVSIATPTSLHAEIGFAALEAGKHVLVEKPIAATLQEGLALAASSWSATWSASTRQ
jgi:predicted dehydrogenase